MITKYNFHKDKCYLHSLYERRGKVNLSKMPIEKTPGICSITYLYLWIISQ